MAVDTRKVMISMDTTLTGSADTNMLNHIAGIIRNAGFKVETIGVGPNKWSNWIHNQGGWNASNTILLGIVNGIDAGVVEECTSNYGYNKSDGAKIGLPKGIDRRWHGPNGFLHNDRNNTHVLACFYRCKDFYNPGSEYYDWLVRAHDDNYSKSSFKGVAHPRALLEEYGHKIIWAGAGMDMTGDIVAQKFIEMFDDSVTPTDTNTPTITPDDPQVDTPTTVSVDTTKKLSEQVITEVYTNAYYNEVLTAKTDRNGAFKLPLKLPYPGKYSVNINFAGSKDYNSVTHNVSIDNYTGTEFVPKLLETTTVNKYTDSSTDSIVTGSSKGYNHTISVITTKTFKDGVFDSQTSKTINNDNVSIVEPANPALVNNNENTNNESDNTITQNGDKKDPFKEKIPAVEGVPNVNIMQHMSTNFQMVDLTKKYTLTKEQYKEVLDRDSKSIQLHDYVESKYTAFLSKETPNTYNVLERERWNAVEESIYYYLVKGDGKKGTLDSPDWPDYIEIDFANHKTKFNGGTTIDWKAEKCTYWFVADNQDTGYTCGPTSSSVCTQILHKYYSERYMQSLIHASSSNGSGPGSHQSAFKSLGFTAELYSGISAAAEWLRENKPCVYHIYNHYIALADISNSSSSSTSSLTLNCSNIHLSRGSSGSNVQTLQQMLKNKGFYDGEITGTFDETLENSVKSYQRSAGLTVDGWVGPVTCRSLNGVNDSSSKILVCNSIQRDGTYGPLSGWRSYNVLKNKSFGSAVRVGLNWSISEEEKNLLRNFYSSMGGAWSKQPNLNESVRMYYLR